MASKAKRSTPLVKAPSPAPDESPEPDPTALMNIERLRQQEEELERQAQLCRELAEENEQLEARREEEAREGYEAAAVLRQELAARHAEVAALRDEVTGLEARLQQAAAAGEAREAAVRAACKAEAAEARGQAAALQSRLDSLEAFAQRREQVEAEVATLRAECQQLRMQQAKQAAPQRRPGGAGGGGGSGGESGSSEGEEGEDVSGGDEQGANKKLTAQMQAYMEEAGQLQAGLRALEAERAALLRDVRLREEMEQQYAMRGTLQSREIRDANSKISSLERGMVAMAAAYEREREAAVGELRRQLGEVLAEEAALRRLLALRGRELGRVRKLAHEVLLQRSDVEAFLLSSIQQVRGEIARGHEHSAGEGGGRARELRGVVSAGMEVDIRELSWEERERVLRQLFMCINNQHRRALPQRLVPAAAEVQLRGPCTEAGPAGLA